MSNLIPITINLSLPLSTIETYLPVLNKHNDSLLKDVIIDLYSDCRKDILFKTSEGIEILQKLWLILRSNNIYLEFLNFLNDMYNSQQYYNYILNFLNKKLDKDSYQQIKDNENYHQKLIDLLIHSQSEDMMDQDIDDIVYKLKSKNTNTTTTTTTTTTKDVIDNIDKLTSLDDSLLEELFENMGLDENGKLQARKFINDYKNNKPLDIPLIMNFFQNYKSNIHECKNIDFNKILETMMKMKQPNIDVSNIMSTVGPLINEFLNTNKNKQHIKKNININIKLL